MPVRIIAVVFLLVFLVMGTMLFTAMVAEQKGHLFSGKWAGQPKGVKPNNAVAHT